MPNITKAQIKTIRGMESQVFDDDTQYRNFLYATFPEKDWSDPSRPSTKDLTKKEAHRAIQALKEAQGRGTPDAPARPTPPPQSDKPWEGRYKGHPNRHQAKDLTQPQADEIARLEYQLGWIAQPDRIRKFIRRQLGTKMHVTDLSKREATKVITGLRNLLDHEQKKGTANA
jgi:hypothetical protein